MAPVFFILIYSPHISFFDGLLHPLRFNGNAAPCCSGGAVLKLFCIRTIPWPPGALLTATNLLKYRKAISEVCANNKKPTPKGVGFFDKDRAGFTPSPDFGM